MGQLLVGRYALDVPLGSGAMGEVWRGRDLATRQVVAVKLVQLASAGDQAQVSVTIARFRREADTLARLRHPNIISALAAGRVGNELFMVMELAEGMSLHAMLEQRLASRQGLFPVKNVLHLAGQVCSGLAAAHAIGVVHRDIKPSNLMVSSQGHLMIVDFGIARLLEDNSPRLTAPSETVGTLSYMSPEQAAGEDVDGRSDLYSFGCVLYELLAGRPPFEAEVPITLMYMHLQERPVPIRNIRPDLPNGLPELVDQLLEKDPAARPPGAEYVARTLAAIAGTSDRGGFDRGADDRGFDRGDYDRGDLDDAHFERGRAEPTVGRPGLQAAVRDTRLQPDPEPEDYRATLLDDETRPRPRQGADAPTVHGYRATLLDDSGPGQWDAGKGKGKRRGGGGPGGWPAVRPQPRSHRTAGVLSSVLTFALVAGIGAYVWNKMHQTLKVTAATVTVVNTGKIACNTTVDVVGTIFTNGKGGPVTYQWTKDGENLPTGTVTAASGEQQVRVDLKWNLRGAGTHHAVAIFQVFTPNVITAESANFTYKCAR